MKRFEPFTTGQIVGSVRAGSSLPDACRHAGVSVNTAKSWLKRGRREEGTAYAAFAAAVDAARSAPLTRADLLRLLGWRAREGNVSAMRLLLAEYRRDERVTQPAGVDPLDAFSQLDASPSKISELAARRGTRGGAA